MAEAQAQVLPSSIFDNPSVAEMLNILKGANRKEQLEDFTDILRFVDAAEQQLSAVVSELQGVKKQLDAIQDKQHPIKNAFNTMVHNLESGIDEARTQLTSLKQRIIDGAKKAVAAFKEKGMAAFNKVVDVLLKAVKHDLSITQNTLRKNIESADKSIARIDVMAGEIHAVGAHTRNIGRAARGKELVEKRENGKLAKAVQSPFRVFKRFNEWREKNVSAVISRIEQREERREKEKKPSMLGKLEENKAIVAAQTPSVDKAKKQETSL